MADPQKFSAVLTGTPSLARLIERAREFKALDERVYGLMGEPLRRHVTVAVLRDDTLVLNAESGLWATRLRYEVPNLLESFRQEPGLEKVTRIQVRVDEATGRR